MSLYSAEEIWSTKYRDSLACIPNVMLVGTPISTGGNKELPKNE